MKIGDLIASIATASTNEPETTPTGTCFIDPNHHLHTFDGAHWRDDGPIDEVSQHMWQQIRTLADRVAALEAFTNTLR